MSTSNAGIDPPNYGLPVFPAKLGPRLEPLGDGPDGASADPEVIKAWLERWRDASLCVETGWSTGVLALCADESGLDSLESWAIATGETWLTPTLLAPNNEVTQFFSCDEGLVLASRDGGQFSLQEGLRVAAEGSYVLLDGNWPNGDRTRWITSPAATPFALPPGWVANWCESWSIGATGQPQFGSDRARVRFAERTLRVWSAGLADNPDPMTTGELIQDLAWRTEGVGTLVGAGLVSARKARATLLKDARRAGLCSQLDDETVRVMIESALQTGRDRTEGR